MSPEQGQLVCDALVHLGPVETEQGLHAEGVRKIQEVLHCSLADARSTLRELRLRKRIEETTTSSSNLTSRTFSGYSRQRSEREKGELTRHSPRADSAPLLPFSSRWGCP